MVNKVIIVGNLGKDPEVRFTPGGRALARFPVATSEKWTDQDGNRQERTEWHNVVVWGKQAESCGQYLAKGRPVFIEGRLKLDSWQDQSGNKRSKMRVVVESFQFVDSKGGGGGNAGGRSAPQREPATTSSASGDEDIPF